MMGIYDQPTEPPDDFYIYGTRCQRCKQDPCECCIECGAGPDQACEEECGLRGWEGEEA